MTNETFTMWFQDGGGRETFTGRTKLKELAKRYDFNADDVIKFGKIEMLDDDQDVIGGVFRDE